MIQDISAPVSTQLIYDHRKNLCYPHKIMWDGKEYIIKKVGMHYKFRKGSTLIHVFTVSSDSLFFKIALNTDNLFWTIEQISDGLPD